MSQNGTPPTAQASARVRLVLASASPRRRALLEESGVRFVAAPVALRERPGDLGVGLDAAGMARGLALQKACARVARGVAAIAAQDAWVLGADTVVVSPKGGVLGKPADTEGAAAILATLDGVWHRVVTGVALVSPRRGSARVFSVESEVRLGPLAPAARARYLASEVWRGKAGAYGIQDELGLVTGLRGSRSNVIGLPMERLQTELAAVGVWPTGPSTRFARSEETAP